MVFSDEDKAIIKNDYDEKGWNAYNIWKNHPAKGWVESPVRRLIRRYEETGPMDRQPGFRQTKNSKDRRKCRSGGGIDFLSRRGWKNTYPRTIVE